jgi:hypothetical protein
MIALWIMIISDDKLVITYRTQRAHPGQRYLPAPYQQGHRESLDSHPSWRVEIKMERWSQVTGTGSLPEMGGVEEASMLLGEQSANAVDR